MSKSNNEHSRIRNGRIRRDFARLLELVANPQEPDFVEIQAIAKRNGFVYDDDGNPKEVGE